MKTSRYAASCVIALAILGTAGTVWVLAQPAKKPDAPAVSAKSVKEAELNVVTLTPEAETRLGVKTAPVERQKVQRVRTYGGQLIIPPGKDARVTAPFAGVVTLSNIFSKSQLTCKNDRIEFAASCNTPQQTTRLQARGTRVLSRR